MFKFIGSFSLIGFLISSGLIILMFLSPHIRDFLGTSFGQLLLISIWPSSILMAAMKSPDYVPGVSPEYYPGDWIVYALSISVNIFIYTMVGYLFWLGKHKFPWILYATGILIICFWSWLWLNPYFS